MLVPLRKSFCSLDGWNASLTACSAWLAELVYESSLSYNHVSFQNNENSKRRPGSLPPTQEITTRNNSPPETSGFLPPSDFSTGDSSLADVTDSDIDTQVVLDLVKGRANLDGEEILSTHRPRLLVPWRLTAISRHGYSTNMA